jgi:subfamily B ATP-binding cassette protein MsbA
MTRMDRKLLRYVGRYRLALSAALLLSSMVGTMEVALAVLIGVVVSRLGGQPPAAVSGSLAAVTPFVSQFSFGFLLLVLVGVTIVKAVAEYGAITATAYLGQSVVRDLRNDVFDRILRQPLRFFQGNPTSELMSRISADVERIQSAASDTLADFLKQGAILVFLVVAIVLIDWRLSLASLILVPLVFYPTVWFGRRLRSLGRSNQQEVAEMSNIVYETVSGNRIVKAFLMEKAESSRFHAATARLFRINMRQRMTQALSSPLMETLGILVVAGFALYADSEIASRRMTVALFTTFVYALVKLYDAVRRMSGINNSFQQAFGASSRVFEILELEAERDTGTVQLSRFSRAVQLQNITFGYSTESPVLREVSFDVLAGEVVAIVGASGAGKSTLVNLVPRFFDVGAGKILVDGTDVRDCTLESLRRQIAVVTQDVILFDDTIWANIAYGDLQAGRDAVLRAARAALVDDFVSMLPEKFETRIGERGLRLSGGERQRISIARALLKNAPILILDEATSSLDSESEAYVQRALENLMEGRTTIVIAHRLSTVRRANRIVVLDEGRVQEMGSHEELLARKGIYWRLYNLQFAEGVVESGTRP